MLAPVNMPVDLVRVQSRRSQSGWKKVVSGETVPQSSSVCAHHNDRNPLVVKSSEFCYPLVLPVPRR
jgi:hypothetical protein